MTQEDKELLLKDLCARLPYGVICHYNCVIPCDRRVIEKVNARDVLKGIIPIPDGHIGFMVGIDKVDALEGDIKPYLRPMQSMTEEEKKEFIHYASYEIEESVNGRHYEYYLMDGVGTPEEPTCNPDAIDWLNANHFDYRGLIEKGLAIEAPENMYRHFGDMDVVVTSVEHKDKL